MIKVEVAYALPHEQLILQIEVEEGATVAQAIAASDLLQRFPAIDLATAKLGVFSKQVLLTHVLRHGDRIEIYRPLIIDPKEARLARAKKKKH